MKKLVLFVLLLPALALAQSGAFGHGGSGTGSLDLSTLLPIIADSSRWTDGSTVNAIKPRDSKTVEADSGKFGALHVTGITTLDGDLTMVTTATEQVKLGTGSDAAPELSSAGDTNTGIRFPGGDKMQLVQGGVNSHTFRPYRYTMTYSDGDTLGISLDGTYTNFAATAKLQIAVAGTNMLYITSASVQPNSDVNPYIDAARSLGSLTYRFKDINMVGTINIGGKGKTPIFALGKNNTMSDRTDSVFAIEMLNGSPVVKSFDSGGTSNFALWNQSGQQTNIKMATVTLTIGPVAAATDTCLNLIPAGSMVIGVTTRVITAVTGDAGFTGFSVGDGTDADRWGANLTPTLGETSDLTDCTITSPAIYPTATSVILTQVGGSTFATGGVVRVTVHYISLTAPTG